MDDQAIAIERPWGRGAGAKWTVKQTFADLTCYELKLIHSYKYCSG
jgi:hypothetical protein